MPFPFKSKMDTIHGSAHMFTYAKGSGSDLTQVVRPDRLTNGIVLGYNSASFGGINYQRGLPWFLNATRGHGICFGATGAGKNTNLITGGLLSYEGSAVVVDVKGENSWLTAERRRQMGQRVVRLDPWDQVNKVYGSKVGVTEPVTKFNPMSSLDPNSKEYRDDLMLIANGIIVTPEKADPHWTESASDLITGLISAAVENAPGVASFRQVRDLLTGDVDQLQRVVVGIVKDNPNSYAARKLSRFTQKTKEIASIRSTAETQTAIFDSAYLLDSMETDENAFELADLARQKVTLYLVLPANRLQTHGRWLRLIIQLTLRAIGGQETPPATPILFLLDELGTINPGGGLPAIEQAYGLLGGMGVRIWGFFQNLSQLQRDYPSTWETILSNCETIQLQRVNDMATAKYFSEFIGIRTITQTRPDGQKVQHARLFMTPQEIMQIAPNEVICLRAGTPAFRLKSAPYYQSPLFSGLYRPNPLYPASAAPSRQSSPVSLGSVAPAVAAWATPVVQAWAKKPLNVAAALALLLATYTVGHVYSERALTADLATRTDLQAKYNDEERQRLNLGQAQNAKFEADREDILAWRDKVKKFVMQDNVMVGEVCRGQPRF